MPGDETRLENIVNEHFSAFGHTLAEEDIEYVMEFLKVLLMSTGKFKPFE